MIPRNFSLVKSKHDFGDNNKIFIFLGEIPNMPDHCIVARKDGSFLFGYHTDNFVELTEDEV